VPHTIGILLDHPKLLGIPLRRTGHEMIGFYNQAAQKHNMIPFYMSLMNMKLLGGITKGYVFQNGRYHLVQRRIPPVIHNRSMSFAPKCLLQLQQLRKRSFVFNGQTRYSKNYIHRLLAAHKELVTHLPHTVPFSQAALKNMMAGFDSLYIKPVSSSIGKGIIKISKDRKGWNIQESRKPVWMNHAKVFSYLNAKLGKRPYLIQEGIPLAKYHGNPFDLRVSVQKNGTGQWQVTGMVGKVAMKGSHVTNVARGGRVKRCDELFSACGFNQEQTKKSIELLSLGIAKCLEKRLNHLADIGLDIGLDTKGKPYFIEMNGRDLRYSFKNGNMMTTWYKTYENPIEYGTYLYKKIGG
jgi:hypothetical protein